MQTFKSNSGLKYQSLDTLYFFGDKLPERIFKYNHTIKSSSKEFKVEVGDSISLREDYMEMAVEGTKRDGFYEGSLMRKGVSHKIFRFPLYKTEEKYIFYENPH
jgi:hypothetical protein